MKFAVAFAAIVAVAVASPYLKPIDTGIAELEAIVAAIQSPSTDPATASLLEQQLADLLADFIPQPEPVLVEEAQQPSPVHVGPEIIDFPLPDGGALTEVPAVVESPVLVPSPVIDVTPAAADAAAPLVQIILNINQASSTAAASPVAPAPVESPIEVVDPVLVVDNAVNADTIVPTPVQVVDFVPEPIQVVETAPEPVQVVEVEPIQIGTPIMPIPVITLPDTLN